MRLLYRLSFGKRLNLRNPETFNEKLNWLKLYDRRPEYTTLVDKVAVKDYVSKILGSEYIIPTLGVWKKAEDINWDILPDSFVLKCNHDSGGLVVCKDKSTLDRCAAIKKLNKCLQTDFYKVSREWPYKNVPRKVFAEKFIKSSSNEDLPDFKFFCFNGVVKAMFVATDRQKSNESVKFDFFDEDYNHLPFRQGHDNAKVPPKKPQSFEHMKAAAAKLSKGFPCVRIDFYEVNGHVFFGEMTLYHFGGLMPFSPERWDKVFGDMLTLPKDGGAGNYK